MTREELLTKAKEIVEGARQEHYGTPENNFRTIADLWAVYLDRPIYSHDVAAMMVLMKVARLKADCKHDDSWLDIAGYAACGSEIVNG